MTQEEKQLLLKDLCARLPYGVYVLVHDTFKYSTVPYENVYLKSSGISSLIDSISLNERYNSKIKEHKDFLEFKPYLRPMSSMTDEEKEELGNFVAASMFASQNKNPLFQLAVEALYGDFFNKHHIDYRGLIPMGLALEATKDMYKENI